MRYKNERQWLPVDVIKMVHLYASLKNNWIENTFAKIRDIFKFMIYSLRMIGIFRQHTNTAFAMISVITLAADYGII